MSGLPQTGLWSPGCAGGSGMGGVGMNAAFPQGALDRSDDCSWRPVRPVMNGGKCPSSSEYGYQTHAWSLMD